MQDLSPPGSRPDDRYRPNGQPTSATRARRAWRSAPDRLRLQWANKAVLLVVLIVQLATLFLAFGSAAQLVVQIVVLLVLLVIGALDVLLWRREGGRFSRTMLRGGGESYWTEDGTADPPKPRDRWGYRE